MLPFMWTHDKRAKQIKYARWTPILRVSICHSSHTKSFPQKEFISMNNDRKTSLLDGYAKLLSGLLDTAESDSTQYESLLLRPPPGAVIKGRGPQGSYGTTMRRYMTQGILSPRDRQRYYSGA